MTERNVNQCLEVGEMGMAQGGALVTITGNLPDCGTTRI
jgi:hypothetical protein